MQEIARGAEAVLTCEDGSVRKERVAKGYRIEALDKRLREERTKTEARLLDAARRAGVPVPLVKERLVYTLEMEFIEGHRLRDVLNKIQEQKQQNLARTVGKQIGLLHRNGIIHGDLTTSNMILSGDRVYFIDFGLGFFSAGVEDRAVDLHLLQNALKSTHYTNAKNLWANVVKGYSEEFVGAKDVLSRLKKIELRGRYARRVG